MEGETEGQRGTCMEMVAGGGADLSVLTWEKEGIGWGAEPFQSAWKFVLGDLDRGKGEMHSLFLWDPAQMYGPVCS